MSKANNKFLSFKKSIETRFFERYTKWERFLEASKNKDKKSQTPPSKWPREWKDVDFKTYIKFPYVKLKKNPNLQSKFKEILKNRESVRMFSPKKISFDQFSSLLNYTSGIRKKVSRDWTVSVRYYPSAGARYPLEIYPVVLGVEGLEKGVYHFNVRQNSVEKLINIKIPEKIYDCFVGKTFENAAIIFVITAIFKRNTVKYGMRGYRNTLIETGHMAQNLYLISASLGLGCCALSGFIDEEIEKFLDIEKTYERALYVLGVGNKI